MSWSLVKGGAILDIVSSYYRSWQLLWQYDENSLVVPKGGRKTQALLGTKAARSAIASLKTKLLEKGEATEIFGQERGEELAGILGAVQQTFGGRDLYPSVGERRQNLLYFVIKDHPFTDGNKRIGFFLFLLFLKNNGLPDERNLDYKALVALTLLTASSALDQKDLVTSLTVNLLSGGDDALLS